MEETTSKNYWIDEGMKEEFTKYEIARILGARALQIAMDAPLLLNISQEELEQIKYDPLKIAEGEFNSGILPITVRRPFPMRREEKIKKIEVKKVEKGKESDDHEVEKKEIIEEKEIKAEGEIMELAKPEDETEEEREGVEGAEE